MAERSLNLLLCDARQGQPNLTQYKLILAADEQPTVGLALIKVRVATGPDDPALSRKGCFGVH